MMGLKRHSTIFMGLGMVSYLQAGEMGQSETFWMWVAIFALAALAVIILFLSSYQVRRVRKLHQKLFDKQLEMEKNQTLLLTNMSENIHNIAIQALESSHSTLNKDSKPVKNKDEVLGNVENRLLDVTNDLIDFLRLKSKKVEIINEEFNINNVLNEVSGSLCSQFAGSNAELIFDIDKNVPRRLNGDSLHLGQILDSILAFLMDQGDVEEVKLEISMFDTFDEKADVQFQFTDMSGGLTSEMLEKLFVPYYDEETEAYVGLGLFVANELVDMMGGELSVHSVAGRGSTFTLSLPFLTVEKSNKRMYRLPDKILIEKKVFIVDSNYHSALAIKKMFAYFRHEVKVLSQKEFIKNMPNLTSFDIVVLHESLFNVRLVQYLNKIKMGKEVKVIALNALLKADKKTFVDDVIDLHLFKPLNQERIFEMIIDLYDINKSSYVVDDDKNNRPKAKIHKMHMLETKGVTREKFKDFSGKNILIVEDNLINQKVLTTLLLVSGIHITIANNGQEAVDIVKESKINFDIVLMDINMPIMDGYTATQMIRLDSKYDTLPIVAFTALALDSEIQKMFQAGVNAFLSKPLNIGKLYTALAMYLTHHPKKKATKKVVESKQDISYPGINIDKGIKHANNNESLYLEVLKEFSTAYGSSDDILVKLIREHRYEQIKMLCLDMRGLTGSIGAEDMHHLMNEILQKILNKQYDAIAKYKEKYIFEIQTLNTSIKKYIQAA
ncbi:MAG: response regulator [Campylobacterota bacterium]|nr:response regulator [Campylobacterota bacterium]